MRAWPTQQKLGVRRSEETMTTPENVLRRIIHEYIKSKDPQPVGVEELYAAVEAEVSLDPDDLTPPTLHLGWSKTALAKRSIKAAK